jgi:hypothetical protein
VARYSHARIAGERALSCARGPADAKPRDLFSDGIHWIRREPTRVTRLLALTFGLAVAAAALYLLVSSGQPPPVATKPPLTEIDAASRAKLERVLEEAETQGED